MTTRRTLLRNATLLAGFGSLAGCVADQSPPADDTKRGSDRPATRTTTATGSTTGATPTDPTTATPRTAATERTPAKHAAPEETTMPEQSTAPTVPTDTQADPSARKKPVESTVPSPSDDAIRSLGDVRVSVTNPVARKAVAYESIMGSGGVLYSSGRQFVVAAVRSISKNDFDAIAPPEYDGFSLAAGGKTFPATGIEERTTGAYTRSLAGRGEIAYARSNARGPPVGWVAFEPPTPLETDGATIRCEYGGETATWPIPSDTIETLASPAPRFELGSFGVERMDGGVELSLVAENTSDADGEFLAAVYWPTPGIADDDESTLIRREVAAGERIEWSKRMEKPYTTGEDGSVTARVDGVVEAESSVEVGTRTRI